MITGNEPINSAIWTEQGNPFYEKGMTYRQWLAGIILAANVSNNKIWGVSMSERATESLEQADALIKAFNQSVNDKP